MGDPEPRYEDYSDHKAYELAWYTWRAQRRDGRPNSEEAAAAWEVVEAHIRR
jgi:hypothetical protein